MTCIVLVTALVVVTISWVDPLYLAGNVANMLAT
jgi:hypothetical protein